MRGWFKKSPPPDGAPSPEEGNAAEEGFPRTNDASVGATSGGKRFSISAERRTQAAKAIEKAIVPIADYRLRQYSEHACWLAIVIISLNIFFTTCMFLYFKTNSCIVSSTVVSTGGLDTKNAVPPALTALDEANGVTITGTFLLMVFQYDDASDAPHAFAPPSAAYDIVAVSNPLDSSSSSTYYTTGTVSYFSKGFSYNNNGDAPVPVSQSHTKAIPCKPQGISVDWADGVIVDGNECRQGVVAFNSSNTLYEPWLYDSSATLSNDDATIGSYGCYVEGCVAEDFISSLLSIEYEICNDVATAFSLSTAYTAYADMFITAVVLLVYLSWRRRFRKEDSDLLQSIISHAAMTAAKDMAGGNDDDDDEEGGKGGGGGGGQGSAGFPASKPSNSGFLLHTVEAEDFPRRKAGSGTVDSAKAIEWTEAWQEGQEKGERGK